MKPTIIDVETGEVRTEDTAPWVERDPDAQYHQFNGGERGEFSIYWWEAGSGACDCNRRYLFGDKVCASMPKEHTEPWSFAQKWHEHCYGWKRFVIVDIAGNCEGCEQEVILGRMNRQYDSATVQRAKALYDIYKKERNL